MSGLVEVGDGVWVRTSECYVTNTTVVRLAGSTCLVIDPAVDPDDLADLVALLAALSLEVVAGWSTHPHWDHVIWSSGLGRDVPRYSTEPNAGYCRERRDQLMAKLDSSSTGHELELCGRLLGVELDADGFAQFGAGAVAGAGAGEVAGPRDRRCRVIEHAAHALGHGALFFEALGLFVAGDMVSDIEIPLFDSSAPDDSGDPVGLYLAALDRYEELAPAVTTLVPGHGAVGDGPELKRRIAADRAYLADVVAGRPSKDPRLVTPWLATEHERHVALVTRRALP